MSQNLLQLQTKSIIRALDELNNLKLSKQPENTLREFRNLIIKLILTKDFLQNEKINAMTPLMYAISLDEPYIAFILIKTGMALPEYVNVRRNSAISLAFQYGLDVVASLLLENANVDPSIPDQDNDTCLIYGCRNKNLQELTLKLLQRGNANPGHVDSFGNTALIYACDNNMPIIASEIIKTGQSNPSHVNEQGYTALIVSIISGLYVIANEIIETGDSNPGQIDGVKNMTALMYACTNGTEDNAINILNTGQSNPGHINSENDTALIIAIRYNMPQLALKIFLTGESRPEIINQNGYTALMTAVDVGMDNLVQELVKSGQSNPNVENIYGDNALSIAKMNGNQNIIDLLEPLFVETNFIDIFQSGFNFITQETQTIKDYLETNVDNLCFMINDKYYLTNKFDILRQLKSKTQLKYGCFAAGDNTYDEQHNLVGTNYLDSSNINNNIIYFTLSSIFGIQILVEAKIIHKLITNGFSSNLFVLKPSGITLPGIISLAYYEGSDGASADHCQPGKQSEVYIIRRASPLCNNELTNSNNSDTSMNIDTEIQTINVQYKGYIFKFPITLQTTIGDIKNLLLNKLIQDGDPLVTSTNFNVQFIYSGKIYGKNPDETNKLLTDLANPPFGITLQSIIRPISGGKRRTKKRRIRKNRNTKRKRKINKK